MDRSDEDRRVTANVYKALLSDFLYCIIKYFDPDGSDFFQEDSASIHRAEGSLNGEMSMKNMQIKCNGLYGDWRTWENLKWRGVRVGVSSALHYHH